MSLRPYKFVVQAVVQEVDADGNVTGEQTAEPAVVFGCDQLAEWASGFPDKLAGSENQTGTRPATSRGSKRTSTAPPNDSA